VRELLGRVPRAGRNLTRRPAVPRVVGDLLVLLAEFGWRRPDVVLVLIDGAPLTVERPSAPARGL
jgi:hypothetical protein